MESNGEPTLRPSPDEARASLDEVRRMEAVLADRMVTPWWYSTGLGLVEALLVSSIAFPDWLRALALVIGLAGLGVLIGRYQRLTGLGMSKQYFALAGGWSVALVIVILVGFGINLLVDRPLATAAIAVVVFVATVVLGRRADNAMRYRLRQGVQVR